MTIRIILADDHTIVREALASSIREQDDMEVIAQAGSGMQAVELARELDPDVVVMDVNMPELNGIEATRIITQEDPDVRVVGLSMLISRRFATEMFNAGATAYVLKDCDFDILEEAVRTVMRGQRYVSPGIPGMTQEDLDCLEGKDNTAYSILTPRERQVVQLLAEGKSTKAIARCLDLSPKTVDVHRLRVMRKLDIDNIAELTKYAIQEGLTSSDV